MSLSIIREQCIDKLYRMMINPPEVDFYVNELSSIVFDLFNINIVPSISITQAKESMKQALLGKIPIMKFEQAFDSFALTFCSGTLPLYSSTPPPALDLSILITYLGSDKKLIATATIDLIINWIILGSSINTLTNAVVQWQLL